MQRKAVLLGEPGAAVAAAIVEGARLAFVYQATPTGQPYGAQQVCKALWDVMCSFPPDFCCCCIAAPNPFHVQLPSPAGAYGNGAGQSGLPCRALPDLFIRPRHAPVFMFLS